ncbi:sigma-70 family RNA polymerase sigma factor [Chitinophaga sp. MM2321]|uniref:RNA polymerase sigma factor n=1 Tax=Chitinophaga sp. MM2321 TaxID=3137178 RepID=UPI0032D58126
MVYTHDETLAEDIVQMVFMTCWEKRSALARIISMEDYLFVMARNRIFDELKKLANQQRLAHRYSQEQDRQTLGIEDLLQEKRYHEVVQEAIANLPVQQREVYVLYNTGSMTYEAIAGQLQLSRLTIKKHLELARRSVRQYVRQRFPELILTGSSWLFFL